MTERDPTPTDAPVPDSPPDGGSYVAIPEHLQAELDGRLAETTFDSADEYVAFVLEAVLRELDGADTTVHTDTERDTDAENTDAVEDRLESLGYL